MSMGSMSPKKSMSMVGASATGSHRPRFDDKNSDLFSEAIIAKYCQCGE